MKNEPTTIPRLSTELAEHELARWSQASITCNYGAEPPLSLVLALLLYKEEADGPERNGYEKNPLDQELRSFFTQARLRRILEAVKKGEAGEEVRVALQNELNRTGVGGLRMGTVPIHYFKRAYIKTRILQGYEPAVLTKAFSEKYAAEVQRLSRSVCCLLHEVEEIALDDLLALPFRDLFHERTWDYCHESPYPEAMSHQWRL